MAKRNSSSARRVELGGGYVFEERYHREDGVIAFLPEAMVLGQREATIRLEQLPSGCVDLRVAVVKRSFVRGRADFDGTASRKMIQDIVGELRRHRSPAQTSTTQ